MFLFVWILLLSYTIFLAPGHGFGDDPTARALVSGDFSNVDPLVTAVFSMLGLYPVIFLMLLIPKDRCRWPAWPFALFSFGLGAFSILPYLAFRKDVTRREARGPGWLRSVLLHPITIVFALFIAVTLYLTAITGGSVTAYGEAFMSSHLVSTMTVDLLVVVWITFWLAKYEWHLRFSWLAFIPAVGVLVLLLQRKKLSVEESNEDR
ncbi:hypothetical protein EBO34_20190 [Alteribacter keqinensis]|uniref:DUF2834 domain-containing protein n=2 Tax=Alteribacter keqinensis TaxID=2483800 RepID=A0A3M7TKZ5_9BACI|nr:hypothetical protein EBO34_20190 [Alteribacter keqinensis]